MRDLFTADVEKLIIDSRPEYDRVKKFIASFMPDFAGNIELYDGTDPIFDGYGIEIEIDRALERKVWLKSGGYLIVDEMEALTAIDVNTGRFVGKSSLEDTITKTNLEACREVAEQLRIRSIGGMIVVDFIDMDRPHNRDKVTRAFNDYLRKDRAKAAVTRISELGLIEMTRKRTRESLLHTLTEPCTACEGKGYTKSRRTVNYELFRELRRQGDLIDGDTVLVEVHPEVAQVLAHQRPRVPRGHGEAPAKAHHRQGARVVPPRGLRDPVARRQGAARAVRGGRRRARGGEDRSATRSAGAGGGAGWARRPRSRRRWPRTRRRASSIPSCWRASRRGRRRAGSGPIRERRRPARSGRAQRQPATRRCPRRDDGLASKPPGE